MTKNKSYANRGKELESLIDESNAKYKQLGIADVRKIPTPTKIIKHMGSKFIGHTEKGEWVDYVGVCFNRPIIFDAKQTATKSFPIANIQDHQLEVLESWHELGAKAFLVVMFTELDKHYRLNFELLRIYVNRSKDGGRKSIGIKEFEEFALELKKEDGFGMHYLEGLY